MLQGYELDRLPAGNLQVRAFSVLYPSSKFTTAKIRNVTEEMISDQAITAFGTQQNLSEYRMRYFMRKAYDELKDKSQFIQDPDYWRKLFVWYDERNDQEQGFPWLDEHRVSHWPRRWIAELVIKWIGKKDADKYEEMKDHASVRCGTVFQVQAEDSQAEDCIADPPREAVEGTTEDTGELDLESEDFNDTIVVANTPSPGSPGPSTPVRQSGRKRTAAAAKRLMDEQKQASKKRKSDDGDTIVVKQPTPEKRNTIVAKQSTPERLVKKKHQQGKPADVEIPQNPGFEIAFDSQVDTIPGNPEWKPGMFF
jgi:hypothetical protein